MAQVGIHSLVGAAVGKLTPVKPWLMLGIVLGSILPDADNLAVAVATVMRLPTEGLHRTFTHSLFMIPAVLVIFYLIGVVAKQPYWGNLGIGLGAGILLHILLDLLLWFNGVALFWPVPSWVNLWSWFTAPVWFENLMLSTEFLFLALFFVGLDSLARQAHTDQAYLRKLRLWTWIQAGLFVLFTVLVFALRTGYMTPYGAVYLLSLALAIGVTIRMRKTVETGVT